MYFQHRSQIIHKGKIEEMNHPYFCHVFKIQVHLVTEEEESANTYAIHQVSLFENWYHLGLNVDIMSKRHNVDQFSSPPFFLNHILIQVQFIYNKKINFLSLQF